uniref:P/Homo B domain-containing protein n=1 Tax=Panagrolaimus sp. JU765 TaxID=591449 RepID=A0AC34QLT6_9BILA
MNQKKCQFYQNPLPDNDDPKEGPSGISTDENHDEMDSDIKIDSNDDKEADILAKKYGFVNTGRIIPGENYFLFVKNNIRTKSPRKARRSLDKMLSSDGHVINLEQQIVKRRVKRDFKRFERSSRWDMKSNDIYDNSVDQGQGYSNDKPFIPPNDPLWADMWYLHRSEQFEGEMDHNVKEAWRLGYSGKGVVVTILDDGLEHTHPDIAPNYDPKASVDVNDRDDDPTPRYDYSDENRHGTRCAGEVASVMNNSMCVVGIAYNSKIGGIRMLDGDVTDAVEAASLSHGYLHVDIYSASWGPDDDGRTVDGPATLTKHAFERGITYGRRGKGSIFIWASGNGGKDADSCNCDGYTNSIYTLSISSATEKGNIPWYSEACSSTLATAYSSGATGEKMIVTTDLHHSCTKTHTGTSASAPLAAGIAALTLEANPNLSWRDLQHIVVRTAKPVHLKAGDWKTNGVGRNVSHSFGYDAGGMVKLAKVWKSVPNANKCIESYPRNGKSKTIPHGSRLHLRLFTEACFDRVNYVQSLEHVQAIVTLRAPKRGDIEIFLISPQGTRSTLLAKRSRDNARSGFTDWAFMSTHMWGEPGRGGWQLEIDNDGWDQAELIKWDLVLHGTSVPIGEQGYEKESNYVAERSINAIHDSDSTTTMTFNLFILLTAFLIR